MAAATNPQEPAASRHDRRVIVAIGGNAITQAGGDDSVAQDYANLRRSLQSIVTLVERGFQVVLTHGNGPQVGNQMIRVELARGQAPDLPLDLVVADLQGGLGYMIERVLRNKFLRLGLEQSVCVLLTLVEVDRADPAFHDPTKFVGPAFAAEEVEKLRAEQIELADKASKRLTTALADAAEVLTPLQRKQLAKRMRHLRGRRWHGRG